MPESASGDKLGDFYLIRAETREIRAKILQLIRDRIPARFGLDPLRDVQVLTPMNRSELGSTGHQRGTASRPQSRPAFRARTYSDSAGPIAPGDKVMQTVNNYNKEVFNGDIGRIAGARCEVDQEAIIDFDGRRVEYDFGELDELVLAYAVTVHKAQGSEYPAVIVPLHTQHYLMLQRNLLYTALTRGKKLVVLVGQKKAVAIAVRDVSGRRRWSKLERVAAAKTACLTTVRHGELSHESQRTFCRTPRCRQWLDGVEPGLDAAHLRQFAGHAVARQRSTASRANSSPGTSPEHADEIVVGGRR